MNTFFAEHLGTTVSVFFMVRGLSKNVGYHGWLTAKILKLDWLKCPETVSKNEFGPEKH